MILTCQHAAEARDWTRKVMARLGLTLNEAKSKLREARRESFDFLGYTFGPQRYWRNGRRYMGASPSKKSVARLRRKVNAVLIPGNKGTWAEVRDRLNRILRGGSNYYRYGARRRAYRAVDNHTAERVRHFLRQRQHVPTRGTRIVPNEVIFGALGVLRLREVHLGAAWR